MAEHSPGPWIYTTTGPTMRGYSQPFAVAQRGDTNLVCGVFGDTRGGLSVAEANAGLISAAPELLELARLFESTIEYEIRKSEKDGDTEGANLKRVTLNLTRAAIAKAEGRS